jgi:hypothetical protein
MLHNIKMRILQDILFAFALLLLTFYLAKNFPEVFVKPIVPEPTFNLNQFCNRVHVNSLSKLVTEVLKKEKRNGSGGFIYMYQVEDGNTGEFKIGRTTVLYLSALLENGKVIHIHSKEISKRGSNQTLI